MKKAYYCIIAFLICLLACEESHLRFEDAQPKSVKALQVFPKKLQGIYYACNDSNKQLIIQEQLLYTVASYPIKFLRDSLVLDSGVMLNVNDDEALIAEFAKEGLEVSIKNDTIFSKITSVDTLFQLAQTGVLKKFKDNYFLNQKQQDNYWKVRRLSTENNFLFMGIISASDSLLSSSFITEKNAIPSDSTTFQYKVANPSKKELKQWLKMQKSSESSCYFKNQKS